MAFLFHRFGLVEAPCNKNLRTCLMYQLRKQQFRHHLFLLIWIFNKITNIMTNLVFLLLDNCCFLKISMQQLMVFSFILHRKCRLSESPLWDTWVCGSRSYKLWTYWIWNRYVEYRSYLLYFVSTFLFLNSQILTVLNIQYFHPLLKFSGFLCCN